MAQAARALTSWTLEDYYEYEENARDKHEYYRGQILAMAGASPQHGRLAGQIIEAFGSQLRDTQCFAVPSDQRVRAEEDDLVAYPDIVVYCEDANFDPLNRYTLLGPRVLIEILSPSTGSFDRNAKREAYLKIPSLHDYLIVWQDMVRIEQYARRDGEWQVRQHLRRADLVQIEPLELEIELSGIYRRLELPDGALNLRD